MGTQRLRVLNLKTKFMKQLLSLNPKERPKASEILAHPFFWESMKRLDFLKLVSDSLVDNANLMDKINQATWPWHGSWTPHVEPSFLKDMGKYRGKKEVEIFEHESIVSLLRLISEMFDHRVSLEEDSESTLVTYANGGTFFDGLDAYFANKFRTLFWTVREAVKDRIQDVLKAGQPLHSTEKKLFEYC